MLAVVDGVPAGCVMLRRIDGHSCEMKRLFVRPAFQNRRIAHGLICKLATAAATQGYGAIRLETGPLQIEAQNLYVSLGFRRIAPYYAAKGWFKDNMLFFEGVPQDVAIAAACRSMPVSAAAA
jgi:ribosomal protein S18 acetylase RimI-like enzyme